MHLLRLILIIPVILIFSCSVKESNENKKGLETEHKLEFPYLKYKPENKFPGDGSLLRAEDGVALSDGRILVVDQANGIKMVEQDGSSRPFGDFKAAGFIYQPPDQITAPNGIFLEQDGQHVIVSDVSDGKIYRVNISSEKVDMIYDHPYGVNTIYRDRSGALWFTQSAQSTNLKEMFFDVNLPAPNGAVYRMATLESTPELIVDSLYFANGITMDGEEFNLFVAETMMDRIHAFSVDVKSGETTYMGIAAHVGTPDNILMNNAGKLIVASPISNRIIAIDFKDHSHHVIFDGSTTENRLVRDEWNRRAHLCQERLELLSPKLYQPLPGLITGMFYSTDFNTLYVTNLGNDILKFDL